MTVHPLLPPRPISRAAASPAPKHLALPERRLWQKIIAAHRFGDAASLSLLCATLEAHERARRCRDRIDKDGEAVLDRFGQIRSHPLLTAERDARAAFLSGMRLLRLDLTGTE